MLSKRTIVGAVLMGAGAAAGAAAPVVLAPARMARVGAIDGRYQSYNIEMVGVTGGKFWKPYGPAPALKEKARAAAPPGPGGDTPAGMDPGLYAYRPPLDLANARLRKLAAALGPAYVRVSGTWANTTYFADADAAPAAPPPGFTGVLTRAQWKGVADFARAADAAVVTSFAAGAGTRDAAGAWTPGQAGQFLAYTRSVGGGIAAAEFMNEPNLAALAGAPAGYGAAAYGRDFRAFLAFARRAAPGMLILGPGAVGQAEGVRAMLAASGPGLDGFSYHHYGAVSLRCGGGTAAEAALSEDWLGRTDETLSFYKPVRDELAPGKPFWLTETAQAACGGDPWAATFLDTFRYLDQLGRLAKQGVQAVIHNTLVGSDYGLLEEQTFAPRPNYWGALLWRRFMGTAVLESGAPVQAGLHVYAHSLRGVPGGVALLALNTDRAAPRALRLPMPSERYTLSAAPGRLQGRQARLNGRKLKLGAGDELPNLQARHMPAGRVDLPPASITFLLVRGAGNPNCK